MKTNEIYETITNKVIEGMKTAGSWKQLWSNPSPVSLAGHYYQGVNQLLLACSDYKSPVWASFNQIRSNGGTVNKGEKGTFIVFTTTLKDVDVDGNEKKHWMLKYYYVFNTDQCTFDEKGMARIAKFAEFENHFNPDNLTADEIIKNIPSGPNIEFKTSFHPCYIPSLDTVRMPHKVQFKNSEAYYSAIYHELVHSSGHMSRLNREMTGMSEAGKESYSKEELIAELGASFLNAISGNNYDLAFSSAYIASWAKVLKDNVSWVVWAASNASKAVNYMLGKPLHTYEEQTENSNCEVAEARPHYGRKQTIYRLFFAKTPQIARVAQKQAQSIVIPGFESFVFYVHPVLSNASSYWSVTEGYSGVGLNGVHVTKKAAFEDAKAVLERVGFDHAKKVILEHWSRTGNVYDHRIAEVDVYQKEMDVEEMTNEEIKEFHAIRKMKRMLSVE